MLELAGAGRVSWWSWFRDYCMRPNGAYKLLIILLYGNHPGIFSRFGEEFEIHSIRSLARLLGTQSASVRKWLTALYDLGYTGVIRYSPNSRSCNLQIRNPLTPERHPNNEQAN